MESEGSPYKVVDVGREKKIGLVANSLLDLANRGRYSTLY